MVTNEQVNAVLARSGLSMEGFEAFRKRKHGEHKQTKESWLKDFKTCSHCTRDGKCKYQHFGYHQECKHILKLAVIVNAVTGMLKQLLSFIADLKSWLRKER